MYVWDHSDADRTLHLLMHDLDPMVAQTFVLSTSPRPTVDLQSQGQIMTQTSGLQSVFDSIGMDETHESEPESEQESEGRVKHIPSCVVDAWAFEPCGYSMNALVNDKTYHTFHVTPESHCSYGSWETNDTNVTSYGPLVRQILRVFQPKKFTMTLYADCAGLAQLHQDPFETRLVVSPECQYSRSCKCDTHFEGDYTCTVANYVQLE